MRAFGDTSYWIATANPRDQWRPQVEAAFRRHTFEEIVTTEWVLSEFFAFYCESGPVTRDNVLQALRRMRANPNLTILPASHEQFDAGAALYGARPDKGYSLVDCISMNAMRESGISAALTSDRHFEQEGFEILLR